MARNEGHDGAESLQSSLEGVNYFLSLASCYWMILWMIVAIEICMRSKMENKDGGPVKSTFIFIRQLGAFSSIRSCRICQQQHSLNR